MKQLASSLPTSFLLKATYFVAGILVFGFAAVYLAWTTYPHQVVASAPFTTQSLDINTFNYYDLSAVDINKDGHLDIFTTNHSSIQSVLLATGNGTYINQLTQLGLDQVKNLPGLENAEIKPDSSQPGLHIYFHEDKLHLTHVAEPAATSMTGQVSTPLQIKVIDNHNFQVEVNKVEAIQVKEKNNRKKTPISDVKFSSSESGHLTLAVMVSTPIKITLGKSTDLHQVFVGTDKVNPDNHEFELYLKDRHGIAWADINDDGKLDAYISRGALSGQSASFPRELADQFFVSTTDKYYEKTSESGFEKRHCPARQIAWVDSNTDGKLDLYVSCGRQVGGYWEYIPSVFKSSRRDTPNMLFIQMADGKFREAAADLGLDFSVGGTFQWFDVDLDGDADLLWASGHEVALYRNTNGKFKPEVLLPNSTTTQIRKLTVADFDSDGDLDIFAAASIGSKLFINDGDNLATVAPEDYSLPSRVRTASWVDYDNDGHMDLYTWPDGLFQQEKTGQFNRTGLLKVHTPFWAFIDPRVLWFDYDNDGDRDVIIMQRYFPRIIQTSFSQAMPFSANFLRNDSGSGSDTKNNWLEIELQGNAGNREAIGATVSITTPAGKQTAQIGQSESSHYSQGHYRLYFGLGENSEPDNHNPGKHQPGKIDIRWPGNIQQQVNLPNSNRIIQIKQESALEPVPASIND